MGRERTGLARTAASGVVAGGGGGAGGYVFLTWLGLPQEAAMAGAGAIAALMLAAASWARDLRQQTDPGTAKDLLLRLLAALGCVALLLHLPACAAGYQGEDVQWGVALGRGQIGDCSEFVIDMPEGQDPIVTTRSKDGWCLRGAEASDQAAEAGGNILSTALRLLGL